MKNGDTGRDKLAAAKAIHKTLSLFERVLGIRVRGFRNPTKRRKAMLRRLEEMSNED